MSDIKTCYMSALLQTMKKIKCKLNIRLKSNWNARCLLCPSQMEGLVLTSRTAGSSLASALAAAYRLTQYVFACSIATRGDSPWWPRATDQVAEWRHVLSFSSSSTSFWTDGRQRERQIQQRLQTSANDKCIALS